MDPTLPSSMAEWKRCIKVLEEQSTLFVLLLKKHRHLFVEVLLPLRIVQKLINLVLMSCHMYGSFYRNEIYFTTCQDRGADNELTENCNNVAE